MMRRSLLVLMLGSMMLAGCSSGGGTAQQKYTAAPNAADPSEPPVPIPGKDARYTIFCMGIVQDNHVAIARRMRANLAKTTSMKDWYVIHSEDQSALYYGYYRSINDPNDKAESDRAQKDRASLDQLKDSQEFRPFQKAVFLPIDQVDPIAPSEWNLLNAKGYYTLQVQAYKDNPKRKEAAVQAVKDFREKGVEAYYYHGPNASLVTIGTWPREAVRILEGSRDENDPGIQTVRPDENLVVGPKLESDEAAKQMQARMREAGVQGTIKSTNVRPVDPSLIAAMKQYPEHAINYEVRHYKKRNSRTGVITDEYDRSFVVPVPKKSVATSGGILDTASSDPSIPANTPRIRTAPRKDAPLKSFGD